MSLGTDPGVRVTRRWCLATVPAAFAAVSALGTRGRGDDPAGALEFGAFARAWTELVGSLDKDTEAGADAYLFALASLVRRVRLGDFPRCKRLKHYVGDVSTGPSYFKRPVFVVELKLAPGARIQAHNHLSHVVVTLGLEGECRYWHYETGAAAPKDPSSEAPFDVTETRSGIMTPGRISTLAHRRDNVHAFEAGRQGATILDFTTTVANDGMGSRLAIAPTPKDVQRRVHVARWDPTPWVEKK